MLKIQSHNKCGSPTRWCLQVFILLRDAGLLGAFFFMSKPHQHTPRFPRATQTWISGLETETERADRANTLHWRALPSPVGKKSSVTSKPAHWQRLTNGAGTFQWSRCPSSQAACKGVGRALAPSPFLILHFPVSSPHRGTRVLNNVSYQWHSYLRGTLSPPSFLHISPHLPEGIPNN